VRRVAKALLAANVVKGRRVALLGANRPEWIFAAWAIGMVGGVVIPVSTFSGADERDYILRHSDASLLIVQDELLKHRFAEAIAEAYPASLEERRFPSFRSFAASSSCRSRRRAAALRDVGRLSRGRRRVSDELLEAAAGLALRGIVIHTSGTTAHPKAVSPGGRDTCRLGRRRSRAADSERPCGFELPVLLECRLRDGDGSRVRVRGLPGRAGVVRRGRASRADRTGAGDHDVRRAAPGCRARRA
jgi:hypothetical protein